MITIYIERGGKYGEYCFERKSIYPSGDARDKRHTRDACGRRETGHCTPRLYCLGAVAAAALEVALAFVERWLITRIRDPLSDFNFAFSSRSRFSSCEGGSIKWSRCGESSREENTHTHKRAQTLLERLPGRGQAVQGIDSSPVVRQNIALQHMPAHYRCSSSVLLA